MKTSPPSAYLVVVVAASALVGCNNDDPAPENLGTIELAALGSGYDVASMRIEIGMPGEGCAIASPVDSADVPLEDEGLPPAAGGTGEERFASTLFVLPEGGYDVCATPLQADGTPSAVCDGASEPAVVTGGQTTEVTIVTPCNANTTGGLDVLGVLGEPPTIDGVDVQPSKFITVCEQFTLDASITSTGPGTVLWEITGPSTNLVQPGNPLTWAPTVPGSFTASVTATSGSSSSTLAFPLYVSDAVCP